MYGVSTYCLIDKPLENALTLLSDVTKVVEVMDDGLHYMDTPDILHSFSFTYYIHAPARTVNIASHLDVIRKASVEVIRHAMDIGADVNAKGVVFHPGFSPWLQERDVSIFQLQKSLIELKKHSEEISMPIFVENMPKSKFFFLQKPDELSYFSDFEFALDVGHAHICGVLDGFLKARVSHLHIHDNKGNADTHGAIGDGTIDFAPVYDLIKKGGAFPILEADSFDGILRSITQFKRNGIE
ncbi:MAG: TIM barrel protein [Methanomicrobium sp.]|nr:TIM barrel protein [Methanomicrobium sp.]